MTKAEVEQIKQRTGQDVVGFIHVVDGSSIRHILRRHGNDPLPMTPTEIERIPEITRSADVKSVEGKRGIERVLYRKIENGYVFVVEEVRVGRRKLGLVTAYKVPREETGVTPGVSAVPEGSLGPNVQNVPESTSDNIDTHHYPDVPALVESRLADSVSKQARRGGELAFKER